MAKKVPGKITSNSFDIPKELIDAFKSQRGSLFIGAGLSQSVGLPSWTELLEELATRLELVSHHNKHIADECRHLMKDPSQFLTVAQELRSRLGIDEFNKYIRERFVDKRPDPNDIFKRLVTMDSNFIITTNYDYLIEDAFAFVHRKNAKKYTYQQAQAMADNIWNRYKFILKAHGDADEPNKIILTDKDYRELIHSEIGYKSILQVLFTTNTILFLGSSLTDPELNLLLSFLKVAYHDGGPKHFALMDKTKVTELLAERWRLDKGIHVIPYDPKNNHSEVNQFVMEFEKSISN